MNRRLPVEVFTEIKKLVRAAEENNEVLDAYGTAERIKRTFPNEALATGELVAAMLSGSPRAMELAPGGLVLEFILPPETEPEREAILVPKINGSAS